MCLKISAWIAQYTAFDTFWIENVIGLKGIASISIIQNKGQKKLILCNLFYRIWWIIAFALSVYLCMNSIYLMWQKWKENPVIISFDHRPLHISAIPFPSMTICPLTKSRSEIFQYSHVYRLMTKLDGTRAANQTEYDCIWFSRLQILFIIFNWIGSLIIL